MSGSSNRCARRAEQQQPASHSRVRSGRAGNHDRHCARRIRSHRRFAFAASETATSEPPPRRRRQRARCLLPTGDRADCAHSPTATTPAVATQSRLILRSVAPDAAGLLRSGGCTIAIGLASSAVPSACCSRRRCNRRRRGDGSNFSRCIAPDPHVDPHDGQRAPLPIRQSHRCDTHGRILPKHAANPRTAWSVEARVLHRTCHSRYRCAPFARGYSMKYHTDDVRITGMEEVLPPEALLADAADLRRRIATRLHEAPRRSATSFMAAIRA